MSRSFLNDMKACLDNNYAIEKVFLSGIMSETPTLIVALVRGNDHVKLPAVPCDQIPEVKEFIKHNYPDVPFIIDKH